MLRINVERLMNDLEVLAGIGSTPEGGVSRLAFSQEDEEARELVASWMRAAGLAVRIDPAGNVIGRKEGQKDPAAIVIGSHIDTVPQGGKFDGALGVLGGLECIRTLSEASRPLRHSLELTVFSNEEGARNSNWLFGSRAMAGLLEDGEVDRPDSEGVSLRQRLSSIRRDPGPIEAARRSREEFRAYLELHVEQGPVLEEMARPIGVVEGITGRVSLEATIVGMANHAGTTPMSYRRDALVSASHLILEIQRLVEQRHLTRVGTVGQIQVEPNTLNIVPGRVRLAMEFRDLSSEALAAVPERVRAIAKAVGEQTRTTVEIDHLSTTEQAPTSESIRQAIERSAKKLGLSTHRMPSGAGHDALSMARLTEMGMIFVPSQEGISHSPREFTSRKACADGAHVLLNTIVELD